MWGLGDAYERYVGRWSRPVAAEFLRWLDVPPGRTWLDVGCGTGALTEAVLAHTRPAAVTGVDPSEGFLQRARDRVPDARFAIGDATDLGERTADVVVSGLVLTFVPDAAQAVGEFARVAPCVGSYVWDYASGMQMMRLFWDAAKDVDPAAAAHDEGLRFSAVSGAEPLRALWTGAGLRAVEVTGIVVPTVFRDFADFWEPFLGGTGAAPAYAAKLPPEQRDAIRDLLRSRLPARGPIELTAKAWAVRGSR
ncbi:Methyltransferase domain-containing protein [Lentzea albidocapillata subsp. violacea]|uniref:Methyltransferase domain-containing protein n=1 Tax=Lentzea albidocapillata subsp. violacea TaxID=128104 RepID=A0A1G8RK67_9PSEU|nr:class I SAM-dependent methyltransferase [Lentzea albidocapillata]SDJ17341.1 Methyltransferase domain-containing protein [Lentzea albidocapillata subsp. violacea]